MSNEFERLKVALADRYRLDGQLGEGGMATVYLAEDLRHSRAVAIKVLKSELTATLGPERFLREIAVTARLDHPHILPLLDSGEADGVLYYVMPRVGGESLRDRLTRERQLPIDEALAITREVADALHYAHNLGVIHRDVKPENILLAGGHARIGDFGIALVAAPADHSGTAATEWITAAGTVVGTRLYMSPEQATGGTDVDRRTDIYSLAAVAYEMLAGQPPHTGVTAEAILARKLREPVSSLRIVRDAVAPAIDEAIRKALAKVPADRFSTALQFAEALDRAATATHAPVDRFADPVRSTASSSAADQRKQSRLRQIVAGRYAIPGVFALALGAVLFWLLVRDRDARWIARDALPSIERHLDVADFESAYTVATEIRRRAPQSPELAELWPRLSWRVTLTSDPPGAAVFRQAYGASNDEWEALGHTPLTDIRFPFGLSRLRFELAGYRPLLRAIGGGHLNWEELTAARAVPDTLLVGPETFKLDTEQTLPPDMVRVPGWTLTTPGGPVAVRDFWLGRHEVTNAEFKKFIDAGGYGRREFWDPVIVKGSAISYEEAMRLLIDRTGRPGPSSWSAGDYPEGEGDFPVSGVSWFEAAAYARFAGRQLPTVSHWQQAVANSMFPWLLPVSNFGGSGPRRTTDSRAMTHVGAFDMTGNVREWTANAIGAERIILGGSWNDPYYVAGVEDTSALPLDRSAGNGFRLALIQDEPAVTARLLAPIERTTARSASFDPPVSDAVYSAYGRIFDYVRGPLNPSVESVVHTRVWTRERITFDAGYGAERMLLHLYLPTSGSPPYQTVIYWPGWDTFGLNDIDDYFAKQLDFIVKSGRAVAFPIYKGIFDRRTGNARSRPPFNTAAYRDNAIEGVKDLRRTIDYLEGRPEIDARKIGFFGYSWGGVNGPVALAQESRLRVAVIDIGLLPPMSSTPEVDPVNALPRVHQPTLMLSGEFDGMVPLANARRYFDLIGAAAPDKRHVTAPGGHFIPRDLVIRESLNWYDARLGPARALSVGR